MSALHRSAFFLIYCLSAVCAVNTRPLIDTADVPLDVQSGYLHGRSGHIIVKPLDQEKTDPAIIFIESSEYIKPKDLGSLPAVNVADVITRTLGVEPVNPEYLPRFVKSNLLRNARANALFSIESLGEEDISRLSLQNLQVYQDLGASASLSYNVYPQHSISLATTLATGKLPSEHGIVSKAWKRSDGRTFAFVSEGAKAAPLVANVADVLQQTFNGESLVVSTSTDPQQAFAYCPNYSLMKANPDWNYLCLSPDPQTETVSAMGPRASSPKKAALESSLVCTQQKLITDLADPRMSVLSDLSGVTATVVGNKVIVSSDKSQPVTFDLSVPEDRALFGELQFTHTLTGRLKVVGHLNSLVTDDVPDLYALTFASLTGLADKYGHNSPQMNAGARLIDAALPSFVQGLQGLYPQRFVGEIVLMGSPQEATSRSLLEDISFVANTNSADYYPYVYVQNSMAVPKLCEEMAAKLNPKSVGVYCPSAEYAFSLLSVLGSTGNSSEPPTQEQIETYQIALWFILGWIFIILWAVYILGWMSFKKDTFLYSTFNPNWEDRKRR